MANFLLASILILSLAALHLVIIETYLNLESLSFGLPWPVPATLDCRSSMSSPVHDLYLRFSKAVLNLASSGVCVFCLIFSRKITTVVNWCHKALPIDLI